MITLIAFTCHNIYISLQNNRHLKQAVTNMRITLQSFKSLTYNVHKNISVDVVEGIHTKLCSLLHEFQEQLPQEHGLLIRPQLRKEVIKSYKARFTLKRLNLLPKCTIRKKKFNAKCRGRVGKKANMLRKVDDCVAIFELNIQYYFVGCF